MEQRTPIALITGSLGSGKTTLLRRILQNPSRRIAVLMNEFGELAIDSRVIRGEDVEIVELAGGCVCCSLTGEFEAAVREVLEKARPDIIVVEATGLAEADALVFEVEDNLPEVRLDCVICIVDAYLSVRHPHVGYTSRTQLSAADILLVNKVDLVTTDEIREVEAQVRRYNPTAMLFKTVGCGVDTSLLFGIEIARRPFPANLYGDPDFQSITFESESPLSEGKFRETVAHLPPSVFRAKGFVCFREGEGSRLFNFVMGRVDLEPFEADRTELVFIGRRIEEDREVILHLLKACET